jgi:hypothetical protein
MDVLAIKHRTAKNGRLGNGWLGDGQLCNKAQVGSANLMNWQCCNGGLGDVAIDSSQWTTARDGQLGDKALDS